MCGPRLEVPIGDVADGRLMGSNDESGLKAEDMQCFFERLRRVHVQHRLFDLNDGCSPGPPLGVRLGLQRGQFLIALCERCCEPFDFLLQILLDARY